MRRAWHRVLCTLGACPRQLAGWDCDGTPGRCGWPQDAHPINH